MSRVHPRKEDYEKNPAYDKAKAIIHDFALFLEESMAKGSRVISSAEVSFHMHAIAT